MNLEKCYKAYRQQLTLNDQKADKTCEAYLRDIRGYLVFLEEEEIKDSEDITYELITGYLLDESLVKKSSSLARLAASIRSFHQFIAFRYDEKDPSLNVEVRKSEKQLPIFCTQDEIDKLMGSFDDTKNEDLLKHAVLELLYGCGLRISEACSLTVNQVLLKDRLIRVLGKGNKERVVPIPVHTAEVLEHYYVVTRPVYLKQPINNFFINRLGRKCTPQSVEKWLADKNIELNFHKHITPHKLRHSYATHMLEGGADLRVIQELLGHANIQTTEVYTHVQKKQLFKTYEKFNPGERLETLEIPKKKEGN